MDQNDPATPGALSGGSWQTKEAFDQAKEAFQTRLGGVKKAAEHAAEEARAAAAATAAVAREGYQAMRHDAAMEYDSCRQGLACRVRKQPLKFIGFAALGGLILGLLFRKE